MCNRSRAKRQKPSAESLRCVQKLAVPTAQCIMHTSETHSAQQGELYDAYTSATKGHIAKIKWTLSALLCLLLFPRALYVLTLCKFTTATATTTTTTTTSATTTTTTTTSTTTTTNIESWLSHLPTLGFGSLHCGSLLYRSPHPRDVQYYPFYIVAGYLWLFLSFFFFFSTFLLC